ncbi:ATP-dependent Clp protease proteolytic subunit [Mesorhizobium sp. M0217]|uniref:ATP-dependent Clp protease proteolytic subunit n=1 Tax=unclassified Mesorhizobium TaxID=325217 RepID=UPI00333A9640
MFIKMLADPGDQPDWFGTSSVELAEMREEASRARANGSAGPDHIDIDINGDISRETFERVKAKLDAAPFAKSIDIRIDSRGGDCFPSVDLFVVIERHPADKKVAILKQCASGAVLVAMAADIRLAAPGCEILLHPSSMVLVDDGRRYTAEELQRQADFMRKIDTDILTVIAQRSGADPAILAAEAATELPSTLAWCQQRGIVHEIEEAK